MSLENFSQPIRVNNIEEHSELLDERMSEIQLEYVDRLFSKKIDPFGKQDKSSVDVNDFTSLLNKYTQVLNKVVEYHRNSLPEGTEWNVNMYEPLEKEFSDKIFSFYQNDHEHWIEKTKELVKAEKAKAGPKKPRPDIIEEEKEEAGLLHYGVGNGYDSFFEGAKTPINKHTMCMSIHLASLYKTTLEDTDKNIFSSGSLNKLAEQIVDKHPETEFIIGRSWLMSTPIAGRIGFTVIDNEDMEVTGAFWGQFIDAKGQINIERVKKFLETGTPPYKVVSGYMQTEDFLKKYLPKERRGKVILEKQNGEIADKIDKEKEFIRQIKTNWDTTTVEKIDEIISLCKIHSDFFKTELGKKYLEKIKDWKRQGKSITEAMKEDEKYAEEYTKEFDAFTESMRFTKKEVIID